jgi:alcohol dehydrogenase
LDSTTICSTDLQILTGDVPAMVDGRIGHEAAGAAAGIGPGREERVRRARVLVACVSACSRCRFCREARHGQCVGGWILGNTIDSTQAE